MVHCQKLLSNYHFSDSIISVFGCCNYNTKNEDRVVVGWVVGTAEANEEYEDNHD
jgi:hypothetical protein